MRAKNSKIILLALTAMTWACGPQKNEDDEAKKNSILAMASNLKAVEENYVPQSITDDGSPQTSVMTKTENDICAGVDFVQCQPRLIRVYLIYGRAAVGIAHKIVGDIATQLAGAADGSTGTYNDTTTGISVFYTKRSTLDFDLLVKKADLPVGRVSASPTLYTIQFDLTVLEKDKPDSRGGKLEIQVAYTSNTKWKSQLTSTEQKCNPLKPDDPETGRIQIERSGDLWSGQAMFYSGTSGNFVTEKTCNAQPNDNTSLVSYTDLVADHFAAKAALYMFKRSETSTGQIQNFGLNNVCENYPDYCQQIAAALKTTPAALDTSLNTLTNPFCVKKGSKDITWNSTCETLSKTVSAAPFFGNSNWLSPYQFSNLKILIPNHF